MSEKTTKHTHHPAETGDMDNLHTWLGLTPGHDLALSGQEVLNEWVTPGITYISRHFTLTLCQEGNGRIHINQKEYALRPGAVVLVSPNQMLLLRERSADLRMASISTTPSLILEFPSPIDFDLFAHARTCPVLYAEASDFMRLMEHYRFIASTYVRTTHAYRMEIVKTLLYALMLEVCALYQAQGQRAQEVRHPRQEQLSDDFFRLLASHYRTERGMAFYADRMCMTPKYLSAAIKRITGKPATAWIAESVITQAKIMLKTTTLTVAQISEELNFATSSFFVQYFKQHCGITPLKYRVSGEGQE